MEHAFDDAFDPQWNTLREAQVRIDKSPLSLRTLFEFKRKTALYHPEKQHPQGPNVGLPA